MKRIALYLFSLCCLAVFTLSINKPFMEWWADYRLLKLKLPCARAKYGDLFSGCFVPDYMDTAQKKLIEFKTGQKFIDLYILGDSYVIGKINKENFIGVNKLSVVGYASGGIDLRPDRTKKNILIIESAERHALWHLADMRTVYSKLRVSHGNIAGTITEEVRPEPLLTYFFNPNINQNLEFTLFDYDLFTPLKEIKGRLNFSLFNRLPKDVNVSSDKKYLLLPETVDPGLSTSSFKKPEQWEIDYVVISQNKLADYYKHRGFNEVYFSIVPNPVDIVDAKRFTYNNKIQLIEKNKKLKAKYIDVYPVFKNCTYQIYRKDDSHWNNAGLQLWIDEVNKKLTQ